MNRCLLDPAYQQRDARVDRPKKSICGHDAQCVAAPASPDSLAGGHTKAGLVTGKRLKISYHGARTVTGGTPFGFNDRSDAHPFAVFKEVQNGGKIIVMGDGMVPCT